MRGFDSDSREGARRSGDNEPGPSGGRSSARPLAPAGEVSSRLGRLVQAEHWIELEAQLERCMLADRHRLRRRLRKLTRGRQHDWRSPPWSRLLASMARSVARCDQRRRALPRPSVAADLPIAGARAELSSAIENHPVVIVCGATGSGKTTQIPKLCMGLGRGAEGMVGLTQPRRLAARSVADRIAHELDSRLGDVVGYKIRFDGRIRPSCHLKVMTDGILLAEIQQDRHLSAYDTLIIDEAHERSLNIDFLLGYLKQLVGRRPELRVVVSSATIDPDRFSRFFDDAPVVEVSGRSYPIDVRYRPARQSDGSVLDIPDAVASAVEELAQEKTGDTLVFLAGEQEIRACTDRLRRLQLPGTELLPLYARLPLRQQSRVFEPHAGRRIVLATNVAETSLTVPHVRYVVDAGTARISRYSHRSNVQRLPVEPVSKASAEQRKGRCGRVGPGICIRLYAKEDFEERADFTPPEITRANLAAVLLRMRALGIEDIERFPFLDPPDRRHVNDGLRLLRELAALDADGELTPLGKRLARLPLDPRIGRMLLAAGDLECGADVLVIVSGLSVADPRERPPGLESAAAAAHARFRDERSDFIGMMNLWDFFHERARKRDRRGLQALCRRYFLSLPRMREWQDVHAQLRQMARDIDLPLGERGATAARVHRAMLTGLLRNVGFRASGREYHGVRDSTFLIAPSSALHGSGCKWVVAAELLETSRLYAFQAARVRPEWVERAAGNLLRRSYFEAHWDRRRSEAMVYERTAVYGLTIIAKRRVRFAPVSRADAREIFIRSALVDGAFDTPVDVLARHREAIARARIFDHKLRRPDVVISDDSVFAYYERLLATDVYDGASFEAWLRRVERESPQSLDMKPQDIQRHPVPADVERDYPDEIEVDGIRLSLRYRFAPEQVDDGVTALAPVRMSCDLNPGVFEWLVPGLLEEKVTALLRVLPKSVRRELVPLPGVAAGFIAFDRDHSRSLHQVLAEHLRDSRGVEVGGDAWSFERLARTLAPHLLMNFRIVGERGEVLGAGRDLSSLQRQHRPPRTVLAGAASVPPPSQSGGGKLARSWNFGELPESTRCDQDGMTVREYPALIDRGTGVELAYLGSSTRATELTRGGLSRLFLLNAKRRIQRLRRELPRLEEMCLVYALVPDSPAPNSSTDPSQSGNGRRAELTEDLVMVAVGRAFDPAPGEIRTARAFDEAAQVGLKRLDDAMLEVCDLGGRIFDAYRQVRHVRYEEDAGLALQVLADVDRQLGYLVYRGFVAATEYQALSQYPRYLAATALRLQKLRRGGANDGRKREAFAPVWERFEQRLCSHMERGRSDPELRRYRWMLEEFRISLFAQELGTAYPVSRKRLDAQWRRVAL